MNIRGFQLISFLSAGSIFALIGLRQFFVDPLTDSSTNVIWFLVQVSPILLILPGMLRLSPRSFLLGALAAMFYFCQGVWLAVSPELRVAGLWEVGFALALVVSATLALRVLNRDQ